jgi:transcriptional regulator with XRE-family HTH domain
MGQENMFGDLLRRHRLAAGLTQASLAERAGLSLRGLSDIERGLRAAPHRETVLRLADALHLDEVDTAALHEARRRRGALPRRDRQARVPCCPSR